MANDTKNLFLAGLANIARSLALESTEVNILYQHGIRQDKTIDSGFSVFWRLK